MKLDMKYLKFIAILYISMIEAIQGVHVSSKIALDPPNRSFPQTSYEKPYDASEFKESTWLRELPSSVLDPLKFVTPIDNILQPQNFNKLESSRMNKPKETDEKAPSNQFESGLSNFLTNTIEDADGNLITTIKFMIITKKKNNKAKDIPVIDGIRGIQPERTDPPNFPNRLNCSGSIPQVHKPRPNGHYVPSYIPELGIDKFNGGNPWRTGRVLVSDKLPPPYSKTRGNE